MKISPVTIEEIKHYLKAKKKKKKKTKKQTTPTKQGNRTRQFNRGIISNLYGI